MALKILIVDPDEAWGTQAKTYFTEQHYEVTRVVNGKEAQLALYNDQYFATILNYSTTNHSCMQVLKFIRTNSKDQRVIIIANGQELLDNDYMTGEKLTKLGVTEVAVKPFELSHIKELLEGHQSLAELMKSVQKNAGISDEVEVALTDESFSQIRIDEFYSAQAVLFDIYIKLSENKYLKILHTGDVFSKERVDKYKNEKKVESLYFHNSDRRKFIQYNNFLAKKLLDNENVPVQNKVNILKNVTEKFIEEAFVVGIKPQVVDQGKEVCENVFQLIESQTDLYTVLKSYQDFDPSAFSHAFLVTLYSTAIIKQFEWQSKATIETAAMACMFHDVGKTLLPKEFVGLSVRDMTPEQLEMYKKHPELGFQLLDNNRSLNTSIKQLILQHHEAFDGTGFPYGKKNNKIL
ncbi:MAG: HD domain-containing protein, partial [Bdellovibrionales bacterium]|nr:HD domain-containing protein [Bdellovibrionales bacterium]